MRVGSHELGGHFHISRRQSAVGMTSTEAEVKAAGMAAEVIAPVVPLRLEVAGAMHHPVRVCIDNADLVPCE